MNFLAHCVIPELARPEAERDHVDDLIAGGFLGDFVKGRVPEELPASLALGVRLHRRIDAYSNQHPLIRRSCERFEPPLRRFAPIFVDVIADHLLARHWSRWVDQPLPRFTAAAYEAIGRHEHRLPEPGQRFFAWMQAEDLLAQYRHPPAMHQGLRSVARRLRRPALADGLDAVVAARLDGLAEDFAGYFPDLVRHAAAWLDDA